MTRWQDNNITVLVPRGPRVSEKSGKNLKIPLPSNLYEYTMVAQFKVLFTMSADWREKTGASLPPTQTYSPAYSFLQLEKVKFQLEVFSEISFTAG